MLFVRQQKNSFSFNNIDAAVLVKYLPTASVKDSFYDGYVKCEIPVCLLQVSCICHSLCALKCLLDRCIELSNKLIRA